MIERETLCLLCVGADCQKEVVVFGVSEDAFGKAEMEVCVGYCWECKSEERGEVEEDRGLEDVLKSVRKRAELVERKLGVRLMIGTEDGKEEGVVLLDRLLEKGRIPVGVDEEKEEWIAGEGVGSLCERWYKVCDKDGCLMMAEVEEGECSCEYRQLVEGVVNR